MKKQERKKKNKILIISVILFTIILIIAGSFLLYIYTQNYIKVERINNKANTQQESVVKDATPIYINNLLIGGVNKENWVSKDNIFKQEDRVKKEKIDIYEISGKVGTYEVTDINKDTKQNNIYIKTDRLVSTSEYIAVPTSDKNLSVGQTNTIYSISKDEDTVKKALGIYKFLNNTVKINEMYNITMKNGENGVIICATSNGKTKLGVYSVVIYTTGKTSKIIKYNYVKDVKSSVNWPIYSLKFVYDLNLDGVSEIVLQETNDYEIKYSVMEYKNNKFYEVLSEKIKI